MSRTYLSRSIVNSLFANTVSYLLFNDSRSTLSKRFFKLEKGSLASQSSLTAIFIILRSLSNMLHNAVVVKRLLMVFGDIIEKVALKVQNKLVPQLGKGNIISVEFLPKECFYISLHGMVIFHCSGSKLMQLLLIVVLHK